MTRPDLEDWQTCQRELIDLRQVLLAHHAAVDDIAASLTRLRDDEDDLIPVCEELSPGCGQAFDEARDKARELLMWLADAAGGVLFAEQARASQRKGVDDAS